MFIKKPANPNVFVRALKLGGYEAHNPRKGWTTLQSPNEPGVAIAVPMDQPLQPEKIESYLKALNISDEKYEQLMTRALKNPLN